MQIDRAVPVVAYFFSCNKWLDIHYNTARSIVSSRLGMGVVRIRWARRTSRVPFSCRGARPGSGGPLRRIKLPSKPICCANRTVSEYRSILFVAPIFRNPQWSFRAVSSAAKQSVWISMGVRISFSGLLNHRRLSYIHNNSSILAGHLRQLMREFRRTQHPC